VAKRRKVVAKKNPLKMDTPTLLIHLKTLTGKISLGLGDDGVNAYKIDYKTDLETLHDNTLDAQIKHDVKVYARSEQVLLWNAYCLGHDLEVAKQRCKSSGKKWGEYLVLTIGNIITSESYANKHINFYSLCKKYKAFAHVAAPISWVIERVDNIHNYLDDHEDEAQFWNQEPGELRLEGSNSDPMDENKL